MKKLNKYYDNIGIFNEHEYLSRAYSDNLYFLVYILYI